MILSNLKRKTMAMYANLCNVYRDEGEKEETCKEELQGNFAEDLTAALIALFILYRKVIGNEDDVIGFTYLLNRLAIQHVMENPAGDTGEENEEDDEWTEEEE